jgi:nucleotide-binding universal stress UspA family protein
MRPAWLARLWEAVTVRPGDRSWAPADTGARPVLAAARTDAIGEQVVAAGLRLATAGARPLVLLHVIVVPLDRALDEAAPAERRAARDTFGATLEAAERQGVPVRVEVVRARKVGETILAAAEAHQPSTIVMGTRTRRRRGGRLFRDAADLVARRAGCEVVVIAMPREAAVDSPHEAAERTLEG